MTRKSTNRSFRAAYPNPERSGVAPFIEEWGHDIMILKRVEDLRAAGHSLRLACKTVEWSLFQYLFARLFCSRKDIYAAPKTPRFAGPRDPQVSVETPQCIHMIHPDHKNYSPYPTTMDEIERLFAFNDHRRDLFSGFVDLTVRIRALRFEGYIWLGGSYISSKVEPSDVDILLIVTAGPRLPWRTRAICCNGPFDRVETKSRYGCDVFVVDCRSDVSHLPRAIAYWVHHLSMPAEEGAPAKGFFEIKI